MAAFVVVVVVVLSGAFLIPHMSVHVCISCVWVWECGYDYVGIVWFAGVHFAADFRNPVLSAGDGVFQIQHSAYTQCTA